MMRRLCLLEFGGGCRYMSVEEALFTGVWGRLCLLECFGDFVYWIIEEALFTGM